MSSLDIKIEEIKYAEKKNVQSSRLVLKFSGKNINTSVINALRRIALASIPTYAFCNDSITIEKSLAAINDDMLRLRLSNMPIYDILPSIYYLSKDFWDETKVDYSDITREKHIDDNILIEMYLKKDNTTNDIIDVTTNDAEIYVDGDKKDMYDMDFPSLILRLRPKDMISLRAVGVLSVGSRNDIWSACSNCYYEQPVLTKGKEEKDDILDPNKFIFTIKSQGQMTEYEILKRSCLHLSKKLELLEVSIKKEYSIPENKGKKFSIIKLINEDHTIGNVLSVIIQDNPKVLFAGYSKPDLLEEIIKIKIRTKTGDSLDPLYEAISDAKSIFKNIHDKLNGFKSKKKSK